MPHSSATNDVITLCLVTVWAMRTGRPSPATPYNERTPEELEAFWNEADPAETHHVQPLHACAASSLSQALLSKTTSLYPSKK